MMAAGSATKTLVAEEEYLHGHFGDRTPEYVEGEVIDRTMPGLVHSIIQGLLVHLFIALRRSFPIYACPELRLKVNDQRYRIADLAVFHGEMPKSSVPEETPLVVIEIVSPDDLWNDIDTKLKEYSSMGVPHVWLVDPQSRTLRVHNKSGIVNVDAFELPQFGLRITFDDLLP